MKQNLTELVFILDRSGSMSSLESDTIGGFNSMIEKQKKETGEAYVTTVLFNHEYTLLHDHVNLQDVQPMTAGDYWTRGTTALFDAVGSTINSVGRRLSDTPEDERPEKVIFVITTDGYENASKEFNRSKVKEMIEHQQSKYSWLFMFLGANIDAAEEASNMGINAMFARTYTASDVGTTSVYSAVTEALASTRGCDFDDFCALTSSVSSCSVEACENVTATKIATALDNIV